MLKTRETDRPVDKIINRQTNCPIIRPTGSDPGKRLNGTQTDFAFNRVKFVRNVGSPQTFSELR